MNDIHELLHFLNTNGWTIDPPKEQHAQIISSDGDVVGCINSSRGMIDHIMEDGIDCTFNFTDAMYCFVCNHDEGFSKIRAEVSCDEMWGDELRLTRNGHQWNTFTLDEEAARVIIFALEKYLREKEEK